MEQRRSPKMEAWGPEREGPCLENSGVMALSRSGALPTLPERSPLWVMGTMACVRAPVDGGFLPREVPSVSG